MIVTVKLYSQIHSLPTVRWNILLSLRPVVVLTTQVYLPPSQYVRPRVVPRSSTVVPLLYLYTPIFEPLDAAPTLVPLEKNHSTVVLGEVSRVVQCTIIELLK